MVLVIARHYKTKFYTQKIMLKVGLKQSKLYQNSTSQIKVHTITIEWPALGWWHKRTVYLMTLDTTLSL